LCRGRRCESRFRQSHISGSVHGNNSRQRIQSKAQPPGFYRRAGINGHSQRQLEGLAIGAAISGIIVVIGENVVGMDPKSEYKKGKVVARLNWKEGSILSRIGMTRRGT